MPGNLYELLVNEHDLAGNFFMSRVYFEVTETGTPDPWQLAGDLITDWKLKIENKWLQCQGADVSLDFYRCKRVTGTGGSSNLQMAQNFGLAPNQSSAAGVCADITIQNTNISNRPGHIYLGGPPTDVLQGSTWQAPYVTKINALINALQTGLTVGGGPAILSVLYKKLKSWTHQTHMNLNPKPTLLNKRTKPMV